MQVSDSKRRDVLQLIMKKLLISCKTCCALGVKIQILSSLLNSSVHRFSMTTNVPVYLKLYIFHFK